MWLGWLDAKKTHRLDNKQQIITDNMQQITKIHPKAQTIKKQTLAYKTHNTSINKYDAVIRIHSKIPIH